ncbi:cytochrome B6 [Geotalea sp. SG265]|uniref:cytochrome B6 n=1 Tax=Geotalea sp. SG265 TaxID=2922867 RepID=UPI001FB03C8F|nr:cytochrome B6 [Geotalea sp. SG265]
MNTKKGTAIFSLLAVTGLVLISTESWTQTTKQMPADAVQEAQSPRNVPITRPEQKKNEHDLKDIFAATKSESSSAAFKEQPDEGKVLGFDFYRDPFNAKKPLMTFDEVYKADVEEKPKVMEKQKQLLEKRYNLKPNLSSAVKMTRGKPIAIGPTARLQDGDTWDSLAAMNAADIRAKNVFPYPPLPHPKQATGGQVFPKIQIDMFPRLQRFDVDFDLPDAFLPEFPPAIFLQNRPELGDVSRGEVVSINNYYRLFKDLLTPVQLDGLRMLVTPFPQEEFNPTDDRKSAEASLGVACLDCHVNGHTTAQFHLNPDIRPEERRFRLDTTSLRGLFNQQIHSSKRSLRSVEDFTEFEQRTAYFNGDEIRAAKKGMNIISRVQVSHMAQMQNMFDVPPAPKLDVTGRLDPARATQAELAGEKIFFEKGKCGNCHMPPFYMDQQMHDLKLERFTQEPGDGPIKTFTLRGIKESPPYMHDGRCLTLEDTVEFFNLVLGLKLTGEEKKNLVAFMYAL